MPDSVESELFGFSLYAKPFEPVLAILIKYPFLRLFITLVEKYTPQ